MVTGGTHNFPADRELAEAAIRAWPETPYMCRVDVRDPKSVLCDPALSAVLGQDRRSGSSSSGTKCSVISISTATGRIVAAYRDATAPGSHLVLSHGTNEYRPADTPGITAVYTRASHGIVPRGRARITRLTAGYELLDPGVVDVFRWRPEAQTAPDPLNGDPARYSTLVAVGRRP